jgi:hypothetical protein
MNFEAIKDRSKKEAIKALENFNWTSGQVKVLEQISMDGSIDYTYDEICKLFSVATVIGETLKMPIALQWNLHYNKRGQKIMRKSDISFLPLF